MQTMSLIILLGLLAAIPRPAVAQGAAIEPGDARLRPERVRLATDTIVVLITPKDGTERTAATLIRTLARVDGSDGPMFRETQRYAYDAGSTEVDTLDVSATSLALRHIAEISTHTRNELDVVGSRLIGVVSPSDSTVARVDIARPLAFHDMMLEAFIGAFPLDPGSSLSIPVLRPPNTDVHVVDVDVSRTTEILRTARGPLECLKISRRGRPVTTWLSRLDGHIVRLRWTTADGSTVWKLPAADVQFRSPAPDAIR